MNTSNPGSSPATSTAKTPKGRVLVVDDVAENREILSYYLEKAGFSVVTADNGFLAVQGLVGGATLRRSTDRPPPFDLVLMDMQMPKLDGYSAVRQLRAEGFRTPIIAVTAHTLAGDREKCLAAGCDEYLGKPVEPERFISTCEALVAKGRAQKAA